MNTNPADKLFSNENVGIECDLKLREFPDLVKHIIDFYNGKIDFEKFKGKVPSYFKHNENDNSYSFGDLGEYSIIIEIDEDGKFKDIKKKNDFTLKCFLESLNKDKNHNGNDYYNFKLKGKEFSFPKKMIEEIAWILYFIEYMMNEDVNDTRNGVSGKLVEII